MPFRSGSPLVVFLTLLAFLAACAAPAAPVSTPTPAGPPPTISAVTPDRTSLGRYERLELQVDLQATFDRPFDSRDVALNAVFHAPSGAAWTIPGFWDGKGWRVRFTPGETGAWRYTVQVQDRFGSAEAPEAAFDVTTSDRRGWLQVASWRDPQLSSRYLIYHDGTPFYGVGHCEAFTIGDDRMDANGDLVKLNRMQANGENLVVWWPHENFNFFRDSVQTYERIDLHLIDAYLASAERLGIIVVYTVWHHDMLRGPGHPWGRPGWSNNGFRTVTPNAADFFTDETSWRWQENLYRYIIARWGYSPNIMWMTVSELDGTSAGAAQDAWHARVNEYFVRHDPYRHPTTASLSGDKFWPEGYAVTDIPQVHLYEAQKDPIAMGDSVAEWTTRLWQNQARPNVIGEFGTTNRGIDLPLLHNSIWGALMSGAAITPLRWSDRGSWGRMSDKLMAQLGHLRRFTDDIPFPSLKLEPADVRAEGGPVHTRGLANDTYAIIWVQDREPGDARSGVRVTIGGMTDGTYTVRPYDTWEGQELPAISGQAQGSNLMIEVPTFSRDLALKITRATD